MHQVHDVLDLSLFEKLTQSLLIRCPLTAENLGHVQNHFLGLVNANKKRNLDFGALFLLAKTETKQLPSLFRPAKIVVEVIQMFTNLTHSNNKTEENAPRVFLTKNG